VVDESVDIRWKEKAKSPASLGFFVLPKPKPMRRITPLNEC
jgi:hypothetical protein